MDHNEVKVVLYTNVAVENFYPKCLNDKKYVELCFQESYKGIFLAQLNAHLLIWRDWFSM